MLRVYGALLLASFGFYAILILFGAPIVKYVNLLMHVQRVSPNFLSQTCMENISSRSVNCDLDRLTSNLPFWTPQSK